jgi:hypothetical protein
MVCVQIRAVSQDLMPCWRILPASVLGIESVADEKGERGGEQAFYISFIGSAVSSYSKETGDSDWSSRST